MGTIVNSFATVGVVVLFAWLYRYARIVRKGPETAPQDVSHEMLVDVIDQQANGQQAAVTEAVESDTPAEDLAKLSNKRRHRT